MQKRTLTIIAVLGLLSCIMLTVMMNTYLEPLKTLPKLRDEIAFRHADFLEEGSQPGVKTLTVDEGGASKLGYVIQLRPKEKFLTDAKSRDRQICAVAFTVFQSEWRNKHLEFVEIVVKSDAQPIRRRLTLDDARKGRPGTDQRRRPTD